MKNSKMMSLLELADTLGKLRAEGRRVVLCHGVFDLLHIGHIRYLRRARELGDILVVTVSPDRFVDKGPGRPAFTEQLRLEGIASLACVDYVALNEWPTAEETLRLLKPDVYAKGAEFKDLQDPTGKIGQEAAVAAELGVTIEFIEDIVFSSSNLINRYLASFSEDCLEYLDLFRKRYTPDALFGFMDAFRPLKVLLVGDAIIDEYVYCSPLGTSSKDAVLAVQHQSGEQFAGGGAAIANHLAQHVREVVYCTVVGDDDAECFIRERLAPNVRMLSVVEPNTPTVRKVRILDGYSYQKHLEIYHMKNTRPSEAVTTALGKCIQEALPGVDLVLSADFGNGCIDQSVVEQLCASDVFLAVNTQANAGNRGFHTISRYSRADFVSLAYHELQLEYRNSSMHKLTMLHDLCERMKARTVLLTEGKKGCSATNTTELQRAPAFAHNVVDRVGAGDALFSITSLASYCGLPLDVTAFLGNVAGSLAVEVIGNAKAVRSEAMRRYITTLMK